MHEHYNLAEGRLKTLDCFVPIESFASGHLIYGSYI
jgi:hypothetical protein